MIKDRRLLGILCLAATLTLSLPVKAEDIVIIGLFTGKAVLTINGERRVMAVGDTSPEGYTLVKADSNEATLKINGKTYAFTLGSQTSLKFAAPAETVLRLKADGQGMYTQSGTINNTPIDFLVDTGATFVALNRNQAGRLGIDYKRVGKPVQVSTASRVETNYMVTLASIKVGPIELRDVQAVISENEFPTEALLGNSFLNRLEMSRSTDTVTLKKK